MINVDIDVPDNTSGEWRVETFTVKDDDFSQKISKLKTGRWVPGGTYKRLMRNGTVVMSNTPDELNDFMHFLRKASGSVLINGLGLGTTVKMLLEKDDVTDITVVEISPDVIKLVAPSYLDKRVTIINADALEYKPEKGKRYDYVWHDIWDYITSDNLPEMKRLHRKYGRICGYQESWRRYSCEQQYRADKMHCY